MMSRPTTAAVHQQITFKDSVQSNQMSEQSLQSIQAHLPQKLLMKEKEKHLQKQNPTFQCSYQLGPETSSRQEGEIISQSHMMTTSQTHLKMQNYTLEATVRRHCVLAFHALMSSPEIKVVLIHQRLSADSAEKTKLRMKIDDLPFNLVRTALNKSAYSIRYKMVPVEWIRNGRNADPAVVSDKILYIGSNSLRELDTLHFYLIACQLFAGTPIVTKLCHGANSLVIYRNGWQNVNDFSVVELITRQMYNNHVYVRSFINPSYIKYHHNELIRTHVVYTISLIKKIAEKYSKLRSESLDSAGIREGGERFAILLLYDDYLKMHCTLEFAVIGDLNVNLVSNTPQVCEYIDVPPHTEILQFHSVTLNDCVKNVGEHSFRLISQMLCSQLRDMAKTELVITTVGLQFVSITSNSRRVMVELIIA